MKGMRLSVKLIIPHRDHPSVPDRLEATGRVTEAVGDRQRIANAINEIEQLVNAQLPHLRLHVSLEE